MHISLHPFSSFAFSLISSQSPQSLFSPPSCPPFIAQMTHAVFTVREQSARQRKGSVFSPYMLLHLDYFLVGDQRNRDSVLVMYTVCSCNTIPSSITDLAIEKDLHRKLLQDIFFFYPWRLCHSCCDQNKQFLVLWASECSHQCHLFPRSHLRPHCHMTASVPYSDSWISWARSYVTVSTFSRADNMNMSQI